MAKLGLMLESQEDLNWEILFGIAEKVEQLGFESLFLSDHLTSVKGNKQLDSIPVWPALTALAMRTERIKIGPLVCSMTFRHPAQLAKMSVAVDQLSAGRLELGLGAGWYEEEHVMFGVNFPSARHRLELLQEGIQLIKALWSGQSSSFAGHHYQLSDSEMHPAPAQSSVPLIVGGMGNTTLKIAATHADEWNSYYVSIDTYREKSQVIDKHCNSINRDPSTLRHSLMTPYVIGKNDQEIESHIAANREVFPNLPGNLKDWHEAGFIGGSPQQLLDQMSDFEEAGVSRFILEHNSFRDQSPLELLAEKVLPVVTSG